MRKLQFIVLSIFILSQNSFAAPKCVQIYYDRASGFGFGRAAVIPLQNLLGHFSKVSRFIIPIDLYKKGDLEKCEASFYLGSYFDGKIPSDFLLDFEKTEKSVVWAGYNVWQLGSEVLNRIWGVKYSKIEGLNWKNKDEMGRPGFFKYFEYKGELFEKYGELRKEDPEVFVGAYELVHLAPLHRTSKVLSWAKHSTIKEKIPYIIENKKRWYVADLPFIFMTEEDRYLIFSDILFDVLEEKPIYPELSPAFVRFEDLHPLINTYQIDKILEVTAKLKIPYGLSIIPVFSDPLGAFAPLGVAKKVPLSDSPDFTRSLEAHLKNNASILYHGVTHQYEDLKNPFNGVSGADCEFWDCSQSRSVAKESVKYFLDKLEWGMRTLQDAGFRPAGWLTPHYMGSPLANTIFAEVFSWNIGRVTYQLASTNLTTKLQDKATFEASGIEGESNRLTFLSSLEVTPIKEIPTVLQFYPYETYSDVNSARFIPENAGFIQPKDTGQGGKIWNVDDILRVLKRNRVLRDVWGSYFIHPFMFNTVQNGGLAKFPGDTSEIERLLKETQSLGYEFINLDKWKKIRDLPREKMDFEIH